MQTACALIRVHTGQAWRPAAAGVLAFEPALSIFFMAGASGRTSGDDQLAGVPLGRRIGEKVSRNA